MEKEYKLKETKQQTYKLSSNSFCKHLWFAYKILVEIRGHNEKSFENSFNSVFLEKCLVFKKTDSFYIFSVDYPMLPHVFLQVYHTCGIYLHIHTNIPTKCHIASIYFKYALTYVCM